MKIDNEKVTIVELKEWMAMDKIVQEVRLLGKEFQLADVLTKSNAICPDLMTIFRSGFHSLPGGWDVNKHQGVWSRTWFDLKGMKAREVNLLERSLSYTGIKWDSAVPESVYEEIEIEATLLY